LADGQTVALDWSHRFDLFRGTLSVTLETFNNPAPLIPGTRRRHFGTPSTPHLISLIIRAIEKNSL
jgi:hypothetical protein